MVWQLQNYCLFIIKLNRMRRQQKTQTFCEESESPVETPAIEETTEAKMLKKQRSAPKFNRTSQIKGFQKRRSSKDVEEHRVCYISPVKNTFEPLSTITPTIEEMAYKFAIPKEFFSRTHGQQQQKLPEQQIPQDLHLLLAKKDQEIKQLKLQIEGLRRSLKRSQGCQQKLVQRQDEIQFMQKFLLEREAYISEMIENNIQINENNILQDKIKNQLEQALFKEHMDKKDLQAKFEECQKLWKSMFDTQKKELQTLKSGKKRGEKKQSGKLMKENEAGNRSKSLMNNEHQPLIKVKNKADRKIKRLDTNISQVQQKREFALQIKEEECPKTKQVIHTLERRIRYSTIELDILRRAKLESAKINEDNERLKMQNRKLLHRIDYLANNFKRDRRNSDSSMDLSLSPSRQ